MENISYSDFHSRLKAFIQSLDMSMREFERSVDVSNGSIASQITNKKAIGSDRVENILHKYPELNVEWLFTGKGEMTRNSNCKDQESQAIELNILKQENAWLKKRIENQESVIETLAKKIKDDTM